MSNVRRTQHKNIKHKGSGTAVIERGELSTLKKAVTLFFAIALIVGLTLPTQGLAALSAFAEEASTTEDIQDPTTDSDDPGTLPEEPSDLSGGDVVSPSSPVAPQSPSNPSSAGSAGAITPAPGGPAIQPSQGTVPDSYVPNIMPMSIGPNNEIGAGAIELTYNPSLVETYNVINTVTMQYLDSNGQWVDITANDNKELDPTTEYRFNYHVDAFLYSTITDPSNVKHQAFYKIPVNWFKPTEVQSAIAYEGIAPAATIQGFQDGEDSYLIINFTDAFIEYLLSDQTANSNFKLDFGCYGYIDISELPPNGEQGEVPGLGFDPNFGKDLPQKYGDFDILKTNPKAGALTPVDDGSGNYYLEYNLTVTNAESYSIPDVKVTDKLTTTPFGFTYVNLPDTSEVLSGSPDDEHSPWESITNPTGSTNTETHGSINQRSAGSFIWDIGTLEPNQTRVLTYYVLVPETYVDNFLTSLTGEAVENLTINNQATVFTGPEDKPLRSVSDQNTYSPRAEANVKKSRGAMDLTPDGSGSVEYTITVSAPAYNDFTIGSGGTLSLTDTFPDQLKGFFKEWTTGSAQQPDQYKLEVDIVKTDKDGNETTYGTSMDPYDGTFSFNGFTLAPGDTYTLTYTVYFYQALWSGKDPRDVVNITNNATLSNGPGGVIASDYSSFYLELGSLADKPEPEQVEEGFTQAEDAPNGATYWKYEEKPSSSNGNFPTGYMIVSADGTTFEIPEGALKYTVNVNPNGVWDLSSTILNDELSTAEALKYIGYLEIQYFDKNDGSKQGTVYLDIDGMTSYTFTPEELGIENGQTYSYVLTYYAYPFSGSILTNVGELEIINTFSAGGGITDPETGERHPFPGWKTDPNNPDGPFVPDGETQIPGVEVEQKEVVSGDYNVGASKSAWYLSKTLDYTDGVETPEKFDNGALYWVITVEGDFGPNSTDSGTFKPFTIYDVPASKNMEFFKPDSLVGVYFGKGAIDAATGEKVTEGEGAAPASPNTYQTLADFMKAQASGTTTGLQTLDSNAYEWSILDPASAQAGIPAGSIAFNFTYDFVNGDDSLYKGANTPVSGTTDGSYAVAYIVLRAAPNEPMNNGSFFNNSLFYDTGGGPVQKGTASLSYSTEESVYKQAIGAAQYDEAKKTFAEGITSSPSMSESRWDFVDTAEAHNQTFDPVANGGVPAGQASGIYAMWSIHVNHSGLMSGDAYIFDQIPEGMTPIYMDVESYGSIYSSTSKDPQPRPTTGMIDTSTEYFQRLDPEDQSIIKSFVGNNPKIQTNGDTTTTWYYNSSKNQMLWFVQGLPENNEHVIANDREVRFRIICKVDAASNLFQGEQYTNTVSALGSFMNPTSDATMTITRQIDKKFMADDFKGSDGKYDGTFDYDEPDDTIRSAYDYLPFSITINPYAETVNNGQTLPNLIDYYPDSLSYEGPLTITYYKAGSDTPVSAPPNVNVTATQTTGEPSEGYNTLTISGLPDGYKIVITYDLKINVEGDTGGFLFGQQVSNTAYWEGGKAPSEKQMPNSIFYFYPFGQLYSRQVKSVSLEKASAKNPANLLPGAEFTLYNVTTVKGDDGTPLTNNGKNIIEYQYIAKGVTDQDGYLGFNQSAPGVPDNNNPLFLKTNSLYCLVETKAPEGYLLNGDSGATEGPVTSSNTNNQDTVDEDNAYYFVIVDPGVYITSDNDDVRDTADFTEANWDKYNAFVQEVEEFYNLDSSDHITFWTQDANAKLEIEDPPVDWDLDIQKYQALVTDGEPGEYTQDTTMIDPDDGPINISYKVTVENTGESVYADIPFSDELPAGITVVPDSIKATIWDSKDKTDEIADVSGTFTATTDEITGVTTVSSSGFKLAPGQFLEVTFQVTIESLNGTSTWTNIAYVDGDGSNEVESFAPYLSVQKVLEGSGDVTTPFGFTATLTAPEGETLPETISWEMNNGQTSKNSDPAAATPAIVYEPNEDLTEATLTFWLTAGESIVFPNLPVGTTYEIFETDKAGYKLVGATYDGNGTISETVPNGITFTNTVPDNPNDNPTKNKGKGKGTGNGDDGTGLAETGDQVGIISLIVMIVLAGCTIALMRRRGATANCSSRRM